MNRVKLFTGFAIIAVAFVGYLFTRHYNVHPFFIGLHKPSNYDNFFLNVAIDFKDPIICEKISPKAYRACCVLSPDHSGPNTSTLLQSECFYQVAARTHENKLCEEVRPLNTLFYRQGQVDKQSCLQNITIENTSSMVSNGLDQIMQRLGYSNNDITPLTTEMKGLTPTDRYLDFYSKLKFNGTQEQRQEFLKRVKSLSVQ